MLPRANNGSLRAAYAAYACYERALRIRSVRRCGRAAAAAREEGVAQKAATEEQNRGIREREGESVRERV